MKPKILIILFALILGGAGALTAVDTGATVARGAATETHEMVTGEEHGEAHEEVTYFGIPGWILKTLNLILFFGVLIYLLKKPIGAAFAARREKIRKDAIEARERRQKAESLAADIQSRLDQIESEVDTILARAAEEGERQKIEMIEQGRRDAEKILAQAHNAIDAQLKRARQELTEHAGRLAAQRAAALLESGMTEADRKKMFAEGVEEIRS
jgi:F-type H+-transporting ATPase subunit b